MSKQWSKEPSKRFAATGVFYTEFSLECGTVIVDPLGHETTLGYTSRAQAEYDCNVMNDAAQRLAQPQPAPVDAMREALHPIKFSAERWEDDEWIVTADGEPCGCTVTKSEANAIVRWVGSAWAELFKANAARTALAAAKSAKLGGES